jgi:hypothetical protein
MTWNFDRVNMTNTMKEVVADKEHLSLWGGLFIDLPRLLASMIHTDTVSATLQQRPMRASRRTCQLDSGELTRWVAMH